LFPRKGREAAPQQRTDISRFLAAGATGSGISVKGMSWRAAAAAALVTAAVCFLIARGNSYQTFIIVTVGLTAIVGIGLNVLLGLSAAR
jgi:hypothetical protein